MDWQTLMAALESWLWQAPYLDIPNYAWIASGLGILVMALYFSLALITPPDETVEAESPDESAASGLEPTPEQRVEFKPPPPEKPLPPEEAEEEAPPGEIELVPPEGWLNRLRHGLTKTQSKLGQGLDRLLSRSVIDGETMEELEELLITSDLGVKTSADLLERMQEAMEKEKMTEAAQLRQWMKNEIREILSTVENPLDVPKGHQGPFVIMVAGVNGTGKTTTIGKLAMRYQREGANVLLGAADTFRAAAIEQLQIWAKRAGCQIISHQQGADPSAVAFDTIKAAQARGADLVIIDTAGRLHTKVNLMEELKKIKRITGRELEGAPHEILLVLDATTGQNAVQQAKMFNQALGVTGLALTKLDGTAKGGIIVAISHEFKIPIRFIGVGEKIYDLQPFRASEFVDALFT